MLAGKEGWDGGEKGRLARRMIDEPLQWLEQEIRIEGKMQRGGYFSFELMFSASSFLKLS